MQVLTAVAGVAAELAARLAGARGLPMSNVYLERGGLLRCLAMAGEAHTVDGVPRATGLIGRVARSGRSVVILAGLDAPDYLPVTPGVKAEICVPLYDGVRVVGVLNVESLEALTSADAAVVGACAQALSRAVSDLGGPPAESAAQRLVRQVTGLAAATTLRDIDRLALLAACDQSAMSSAAVVEAGAAGHRVRTVTGPLGARLHSSARRRPGARRPLARHRDLVLGSPAGRRRQRTEGPPGPEARGRVRSPLAGVGRRGGVRRIVAGARWAHRGLPAPGRRGGRSAAPGDDRAAGAAGGAGGEQPAHRRGRHGDARTGAL